MQQRDFCVEPKHEGKRIDQYLAIKLKKDFSRSQLKKMMEAGCVAVAGRQVAPHYAVKPGDKIEVQWKPKAEEAMPAQDIPLEILHEDKELLVIHKPAGLVVHPANGNEDGTLVNALLFHIKKLSEAGGADRPGIVHRLDKDTSGVMVVAKNDLTHAFLAEQFKDQTIERIYRVAVKNVVAHDEGMCEEPVGRAFVNRKKIVIKPSGGKEASTSFRVLERFQEASHLELQLHTGRTHQIRVHMRFMGHPVLGDDLYGVKSPFISRQAVHAFGLGFIHPKSRKRVYFEAPLPADFQSLLEHLRAGS